MRSRYLALCVAFASFAVLAVPPVLSQDATSETEAAEPEPAFTEAFMEDAEALETGQAIWDEQCQHCHGRSAYPGKAPKLRPKRYDAAFVYDRVTNGFRKMPAWKDVYDQHERMAVTAYILSPQFAP